MFEAMNERMIQLKENMRNQEKWTQRQEELERELEQLESERDRWKARLQEEERDVERLTSASISSLFYNLIGRKEEKLEHVQLEVLEAKAKYDAAMRSLEDTRTQLDHVQQQLQTVRYADVEYQQVFRDKEQILLHGSRELADLSERRSTLTVQLKEMKEAVQAGQIVLNDLEQAEDSLRSARNWGINDMLGGGMISTHMKHSNIDDAMERIHDAQRSLNRFGKELKDVQMVLQIEIDIGSFLKFADYFWDGFISDWMVQGRINDTLSEVHDKRSEVQGLLRQLESEYSRNQIQMRDIERKYNSIIELAD